MVIDPLEESLGIHLSHPHGIATSRDSVIRYIVMKLLANGLPVPERFQETDPLGAPRLLRTYHQRLRRLDVNHCPVDLRIESFLEQHFDRTRGVSGLKLPDLTFILDRHGLARELSLPHDADSYTNPYVTSHRVLNGVLHNPVHDRRTTSGTFHVAEGGLPIPADKKAVPAETFAYLFSRAMRPPAELLELPFTSGEPNRAKAFVSLLIRPLLSPAVEGFCSEKSMEVRFFAPGSLVSNLDFVESIFGNAGDPFLPQNDAGLDTDHWSGHSGCVILAPHLTQITKKDARLPSYSTATERQRRDGMCWRSEEELYNDGVPFKLTCRNQQGVIVTLIADNYYGYCKKEVKTQLSYAANLAGNIEEEHAGGAIAFPSFNLGEEFAADSRRYNNRTIDDVFRDYASLMEIHPSGYGVDRAFPSVYYVPEDAVACVPEQQIAWTRNGQRHAIPLHPDQVYLTPSGYKIRLEKHPAAPSWRLIGSLSEGVFCHKPCTVSGGGKSEISKSIADYLLHGPIFVSDIEADLDLVQQIFDRDYSGRWSPTGSVQPDYSRMPSRKLLDPQRSLGSVIKLLTPSADYTDEYNDWLQSIPGYIYAIVFIIKRMYNGPVDGDWRSMFSVDIVNGQPGHELKYGDRRLVGTYLRVGLQGQSTWRTYKLRQDFAPAQKLQTEDDISVSVVAPATSVDHLGPYVGDSPGYKFVRNCEYRLFQRPDDAVHRGLDKQTEADLSRLDNFIVNFEPLSRSQVRKISDRPIDLAQYTEPMQQLLRKTLAADESFVVCSSTPRLVDGIPTRNPRYLQTRPDLVDPRLRHVVEMGVRLFRAVPIDKPVEIPVHASLVGRRNNPPDREKGIRALSVYNPIHYQELPELFMDFVSSLTGKSPSTTGAGSEGALTKGPFNALLPIHDLNNALVSYLMTGLPGFSSSAGHIGTNIRVDHDISLLVPEIWCRMSPEERSPDFLIREQHLEKIDDYEHGGQPIPASRLGYRITSKFIRHFAGRVFDNPRMVFDQAILCPETQDPDAFAEGILHIAEVQQRVAQNYLDDGSIERACPPLQALLHIMVEGKYGDWTIETPEFRELFTLPSLLQSDWYRERLERQQQLDVALWNRHVQSLERYLARQQDDTSLSVPDLTARLDRARHELARVSSDEYLHEIHGAIGADQIE